MNVCLLLVWPMISFLPPDRVTNGPEPKGEAVVLRLTPDLTFGTDEDEDAYIWSHANTTVSADDKGRMYVTDSSSNRVLVFDANGKYLKQIGGVGEGPGEFTRLSRYEVLADGSGLALDRGNGPFARFHYFDAAHQFVRVEQSRSGRVIESATISPTGKHFGVFSVEVHQADGVLLFQSGVMDSSFAMVNTVVESKNPTIDPTRMSDPAYWVDVISRNLRTFHAGSGMINFDAKGRVYTARSNVYEVTVWDPDMKQPQLVFGRKYKARVLDEKYIDGFVEIMTEQMMSNPTLSKIITPNVLERAIEKSGMGPAANPIYGLIPMEDGSVLVVHHVDMQTGENEADLFSSKGVYQGRLKMQRHAMVIMTNGGFIPRMSFRNGFAYAVETDAEGDIRVVRYRVEKSGM